MLHSETTHRKSQNMSTTSLARGGHRLKLKPDRLSPLAGGICCRRRHHHHHRHHPALPSTTRHYPASQPRNPNLIPSM